MYRTLAPSSLRKDVPPQLGRMVDTLPEALSFSPDKPWLAPLAGWSDLPFRLLCRRFGAAVCCTEMISAKGLIYKSPGTAELFATCPEDTPVVVQLFGSEAPFMEAATEQLKEKGFVWFDCNMGCSVPKVTRTGSGAAMCRDIDNALAVAEALIRAAGRGRVGFKLRLGWDERSTASETWRILAPALEQLGAGWLALHPRTAKQGFTGTARWETLAELKQLVSLPVVASGDLFTAEDGVRCLRETGVDTVMYARGALRDPAIFQAHLDILAGRQPVVADVPVLLSRIREHARLARELSSEKVALLKMRTIVPRYIRHIEGSRQLRADIIACRSWEDFENALKAFEASKS